MPSGVRPRGVRALHRLIGALEKRGLLAGELDFDALTGQASAATGLSDFGDGDWQEPLQLLLADYASSAQLNGTGRVIARLLILGLLRTRLQLVDRCKSVRAPAIEQPVFILGLPRTGSTLLHELLARNSTLRAPLFWESQALPAGEPRDAFQMVASAAHIALLDLLAPDFRHIHRLGARRPHECVSIQALSFRSMQFFAIHNVRSYHAWLEDCDWMPAYRLHARYLQMLQAGEHRDVPFRWLLKAPGHMLGLTALLQQYPDASFIQLHREPREVVPSMASLYASLRQTSSDHVDLCEIGEAVVEEWSRGLARVVAARRDERVDARFLDIDFRQLIADPLRVCGRIAEFLNVRQTPTDHAAMNHYLARQMARYGKTGRHRYELQEFGLSETRIRSAFGEKSARTAVAANV